VHPDPGAQTAADSLRPTLFGDLDLDGWPPDERIDDVEPWASFQRARAASRDGNAAEAITIWQQIADADDLESRHTLQAWHFLRAAGVVPPGSVTATALAVAAEVAVADGHDLLIAYRDRRVRYLNHSGGVAIVEPPNLPATADAADSWLTVGQRLANVIGVWDRSVLPQLPPGASRVLMLTPGGPRFGQGPDSQLRLDRGAARFLDAATQLLLLVVEATEVAERPTGG
jgi:hypothetical protein